MKALEKFEASVDLWTDKANDYLERLSTRERWMVIFTAIFVVVAAIGSAIWYMHKAADQQQQRLTALKDTVVWMQTNVVTMKSAEELQLSTSDKIQRVSQQLGLSVASQQIGESTQVLLTHENYAVIANFLTQIAQMGLSIEKMELISEAGQIKLTATIH